jgi:hypothetical protein
MSIPAELKAIIAEARRQYPQWIITYIFPKSLELVRLQRAAPLNRGSGPEVKAFSPKS